MLPNLIRDFNSEGGILITPFLVSINPELIFELLYYEFVIDILNVAESFSRDYPIGNGLPKEIIENIKPRAIAALGDKRFVEVVLGDYFKAMRRMRFDSVLEAYPELSQANLYYQMY